MGQKRARAHQIGEAKQTEVELGVRGIAGGTAGRTMGLLTGAATAFFFDPPPRRPRLLRPVPMFCVRARAVMRRMGAVVCGKSWDCRGGARQRWGPLRAGKASIHRVEKAKCAGACRES